MELLPAEIAEQLPPLRSQQVLGADAVAKVKFFAPWSSWAWYASEYDPDERLFFGILVGLKREAGYFSLDELRYTRGPRGLQLERDLHWTPRPLKECF